MNLARARIRDVIEKKRNKDHPSRAWHWQPGRERENRFPARTSWYYSWQYAAVIYGYLGVYRFSGDQLALARARRLRLCRRLRVVAQLHEPGDETVQRLEHALLHPDRDHGHLQRQDLLEAADSDELLRQRSEYPRSRQRRRHARLLHQQHVSAGQDDEERCGAGSSPWSSGTRRSESSVRRSANCTTSGRSPSRTTCCRKTATTDVVTEVARVPPEAPVVPESTQAWPRLRRCLWIL